MPLVRLSLGLETYSSKEGTTLIPKKIQPFFEMKAQKKIGSDSLIEGILTCCNSHDFEVFVVGEIKHSTFSRTCLIPENGEIGLKVRCKKCGRVISVFDSCCDGYEQCGNYQSTHISTKPVDCMKCQNDCFSVDVKYEYPDIQELEELEITAIDNAFTWMWITLACNRCGAIYKNFIDYETA